MIFSSREEVIAMTPMWQGERFADGRPKVADRYLDALYDMTLEELWKPIFVQGYESQFIAMKSLHPEFKEDGTVNRKLVGRAVTAMYAPTRPDYAGAMANQARALGKVGTPNQWVIDSLQSRDVIVIDMFDKIYKGTFVGGNLTTAIRQKTGNGGAVIWGGIRDIEQMHKVPDVQVYYRGIDPTPIRDFAMLGMNCPVRLGDGREAAICLPGDIVYGCSGGVLFIPPHLAMEVVDGGAKTQIKDIFGFEMIAQNKFTTAQIDKNTWSVEMLDLLTDFIQKDERGIPYRSLDWSREYDLARNGDPNDTQSAL
ncbi:MAG TPA: RraA family protein [Candidatus Alectryocaccomicrobium excrementavium]|uniref:RraA family protein n=1 Tax=Candidatus Alectryocaccomicrobium excrementavium TaxID=2840668 RepID=A0A9D1FYA2_9FIRM|nr:RraA family protein [Candidatus Alectryocaccomicrobium excrementavium]